MCIVYSDGSCHPSCKMRRDEMRWRRESERESDSQSQGTASHAQRDETRCEHWPSWLHWLGNLLFVHSSVQSVEDGSEPSEARQVFSSHGRRLPGIGGDRLKQGRHRRQAETGRAAEEKSDLMSYVACTSCLRSCWLLLLLSFFCLSFPTSKYVGIALSLPPFPPRFTLCFYAMTVTSYSNVNNPIRSINQCDD